MPDVGQCNMIFCGDMRTAYLCLRAAGSYHKCGKGSFFMRFVTSNLFRYCCANTFVEVLW
jgi:hypothetical protein